MNKKDFITVLQEKTNYSEEKCIIINDILEDNFIVGKKGKSNIISQLVERLSITQDEAEEIYNSAMKIIATSVKDSMKHPFRSKDD